MNQGGLGKIRRLGLINRLGLLLFFAAGTLPAQAGEVSGYWQGSIQVPGARLGGKIDLALADGTWQGTIDIPMQGAEGLPLEGIHIQGPEVRFRIAGIPGSPTFEGQVEGSRLEGTFHQGGASFPFLLKREVSAGPLRPQEPKGPFPYRSLDVSYPGPAGKISGTLTLPKEGPAAAVLLISGSGPQNRDGELFEHKPFRVLADHLSRQGIAVLRVDDRGVGGSEGVFAEATTLDFAEDARAGLRFLGTYEGLPRGRVGLLGHSEGGLIAPLLAQDPGVRFLVLVAAPGVPGREVLARQRFLIARGAGVPAESIRKREVLFEELVDLVLSDAEGEVRESRMRELIYEQMALEAPPEDREAAAEQAEAALAQMESSWFRFFLAHDPRPVLTRVRVPVLALYGAKDLQVEPAQNQPALEQALRRSGNPDVEVLRLEGLNHLMQRAGTGHPSEYWALEETFSPVALERVSSWIRRRFPPAGEETSREVAAEGSGS